MNKKNHKPSIRFKGFTETWEQRKLGELGTITTGNTPSTAVPEYYSDDGIVWVTPTDISETITFNSARKLSRLGQQVGRVVPKNTILVTCIASIGKNTLLGNTGSFNQQINGLTPNENKYDPYFLLTESSLWSTQMKNSAAAGTMQIVNLTEFSELKTLVPNLAEQKQIGELFHSLDNLITLHQCKYEKLKSIKKALLDKMFPSIGKKLPKIRFKGFVEAWEQRKLGECIERIGTGLNPRDNFKLNNGGSNYYVTIKNFEHGKLYLDDNCDKIDDISLRKIQERSELKKNDILFASIGRVGDCYLLDKEPKNWNINESVFTLRPNQKVVKPEYLFQTIHSDIVLKQILSNITGSTFKSIKIGDLKKAIIPVPCKTEQRKIGVFITALDNLITLHQCKYEKLKSLKKALLDKMFV